MNFYQYLSKNGLLQILDGPSEKIDEIKKIYQTENRKEYKRQYQKRRSHRVIIFTHEEDEFLKQGAENHNLPFSTYVRQSALKYQSRGFITLDKTQLKAVLVAHKRYGTLLNQTVHVLNTSKSADKHHIESIQNNFQALATEVRQIITEPILIEDFVQGVINKEPQYIEIIQSILNSSKS